MPLIGRREIPIKRDQVLEWLKDYRGQGDQDLERFLTRKITEAGHQDITVDMGELGELALVTVIMMEASSYAAE